MQVNDVFTLDQAAIDEVKLENTTAGQQYRITQPVNGVEVRASKVVDGKPQKGRPRRFPVALVARLLGVAVPTATTETATATASTDGDGSSAELTETATEEVEELAPAISEEEKTRSNEALARAIGDGSTTNDW